MDTKPDKNWRKTNFIDIETQLQNPFCIDALYATKETKQARITKKAFIDLKHDQIEGIIFHLPSFGNTSFR